MVMAPALSVRNRKALLGPVEDSLSLVQSQNPLSPEEEGVKLLLIIVLFELSGDFRQCLQGFLHFIFGEIIINKLSGEVLLVSGHVEVAVAAVVE